MAKAVTSRREKQLGKIMKGARRERTRMEELGEQYDDAFCKTGEVAVAFKTLALFLDRVPGIPSEKDELDHRQALAGARVMLNAWQSAQRELPASWMS